MNRPFSLATLSLGSGPTHRVRHGLSAAGLGMYTGLLLLTGVTMARAQIFPAQQTRVGFLSKAVGIADMDEDGRLDLVEAGPVGGPLVICLHRDDGTFVQQSVANTGVVQRLVLADFDGDGDVDGAKAYNTGLSIALGDGAGGSVSGAVYSDSGNHTHIAVADLDLDGDLDLVDVEKIAARLGVRLGAGNGTFAVPVLHAAGIAMSGVALGDFNGDGAPDAVVADPTGNAVAVLLGEGAGGFAAASLHGSPGQPNDIALADVDLDGSLDALAADLVGTVTWLRGDGLGGLAAPVTFTAGLATKSMVVADFDADGRPDVAVNTRIQPEAPGIAPAVAIAVLRGAATGVFLPATFVAPGLGRTAIAAGDLTCDGYPDLAFDAAPYGGMLGMIANDGSGQFVEAATVAMSPTGGVTTDLPDTLRVGDVDLDGDIDLVRGNPVLYATTVLVNDGNGGLTAAAALPFVFFAQLVDDLDGDGALDLVTVGSFPLAGVQVAFGNGAGAFATPALAWPFGGAPRSVALGDIDADGAADLMVTYQIPVGSGVGTNVAVGRNVGPLQYTLTANINVGGWAFPQSPPSGKGNDALVVRDFNGDGIRDLLVGGYESKSVYLLRGTSAGGLIAAPPLFGQVETGGLVAADLNDDGFVDVAGCSHATSDVQILRGLGAGTFAFPTLVSSSSINRDLHAVDFELDGKADLAHASEAVDAFTVLRGDGALHYERRAFGAPPRTAALVVADFDGDGRPDVANWARSMPDRVTVVHNESGDHPWTCLGHGLAGSVGAPRLLAIGTLETGTPGSLVLENANPNKLAVLFISNQSQPVPFYGATLIPFPVLAAAPLMTDAAGRIELAWTQWPLLAPGAAHWFQYAVVDSAGPLGAAFSNALQATQP